MYKPYNNTARWRNGKLLKKKCVYFFLLLNAKSPTNNRQTLNVIAIKYSICNKKEISVHYVSTAITRDIKLQH